LLLMAGWLGCSSNDDSPSGPDLDTGAGEVEITQHVGDLKISDATGLQSLAGGDGPLEVLGNLTITNTQLTSLSPLSNLVAVHGDLRITDNPELTELGLTNLEMVSGGLSVSSNPALSSLEGLRALRQVGGILSLSFLNLGGVDSDDLAVPNLESVGGLFVRETGMTDLNAFSSLQRIDGPLQVKDSQIVSLEAIEHVEGINRVALLSNRVLTDLTALSNLQTIQSVWISENNAITSLEGLHNVSRVNSPSGEGGLHPGGVVIQSNAALADLDGLRGLRQVSRSLWITNNAVLTDADGLASVEQIGHMLWVIDNPFLKSVDLSSLSAVVEILEISGNPLLALLDLSSLENVGFLSISENGSLPTQLADAVATSMRTTGLDDENIVVLNNLPEAVLDE
jgi:hypothetical protein